jgi:hypothetical protein
VSLTIFKLSINEKIIICFDSPAKAVGLIVSVHHSSVVVKSNLLAYLDILQRFES